MSNALIDMYSKEELEVIVKSSSSIAEVGEKIGYTTKNGRNSDTIKKRLIKYNISTEHFFHKTPTKRNVENVFCENSTATQHTLRNWYFKQKNIVEKCSICGQLPFWNNQKLTLILDHINGNKHDNRIENLRLVCPNCNQQLETTNKPRGKRFKKRKDVA